MKLPANKVKNRKSDDWNNLFLFIFIDFSEKFFKRLVKSLISRECDVEKIE